MRSSWTGGSGIPRPFVASPLEQPPQLLAASWNKSTNTLELSFDQPPLGLDPLVPGEWTVNDDQANRFVSPTAWTIGAGNTVLVSGFVAGGLGFTANTFQKAAGSSIQFAAGSLSALSGPLT